MVDYRYPAEQVCSCLEKMMVFCDSALLPYLTTFEFHGGAQAMRYIGGVSKSRRGQCHRGRVEAWRGLCYDTQPI